MTVDIPWPPSANRYWRNWQGRMVKSTEARNYQAAVGNQSLAEKWDKFQHQRVKVFIEAFPPDKRKRDLDNVQKVTLDSFEYSGVFFNDEQVDDLRIVRREVVPGGLLRVTVEPIGDADGCADKHR